MIEKVNLDVDVFRVTAPTFHDAHTHTEIRMFHVDSPTTSLNLRIVAEIFGPTYSPSM